MQHQYYFPNMVRFQEETEIVAMMKLRMAYEGNDLAMFERTLHDRRNKITEDPFVMTYIDPLRQRIRESVLLHLCRPYKKITMNFMAGVRGGRSLLWCGGEGLEHGYASCRSVLVCIIRLVWLPCWWWMVVERFICIDNGYLA